MADSYTPEQLLKLGEPSPEFQEILKAMPALSQIKPSYEKDDVNVLRGFVRQSQPAPTPTPGHIKVVDRTIPVRDGAEIPIRIYSPTNKDAQGSPLIVHYHGGGFMLGDLEMNVELCRNHVTNLNAIVVDVDYRLAPEFPFPIPINDSWDALKWRFGKAADNAAALDSNPEIGFLVTGSSAGANLSAVLSLLARDNNLSPPLTGAFLAAPVVFSRYSMPEKFKSHWLAMEQNKSAPIFNLPLCEFIEACYKPEPNSILWTPILDPKGLKGLPRTCIVACGMDPLRDDAILYGQVLREAGVETNLQVYGGLPHCWWAMLPQLEASKKYEKDSLEGWKWLLRRE